MNRTRAIVAVVAGVAVAGVAALAVPAVVSAVSAPSETFTHAPAPAPAAVDESESAPGEGDLVDLGDGVSVPAGGPGECTTNSLINIVAQDGEAPHAKLLGDLVEMGASDLANGTPVLGDDGTVVAYEVAPGDSLIAIGQRFCIDYVTVSMYNHVDGMTVHPGDVLILRPDPALPWIDQYGPFQAEAGTSTIPYANAFIEFSNAIAAGDLGAARVVWQRLGPDVSPEGQAVVTQALADEDWDVLRQLFP